jgi:hypothetical protein
MALTAQIDANIVIVGELNTVTKIGHPDIILTKKLQSYSTH